MDVTFLPACSVFKMYDHSLYCALKGRGKVCAFLQISHPEKGGCNDKQTAKGKVSFAMTVFIPHGQVHKHPALTPGTPTAPWLCSRPGRG